MGVIDSYPSFLIVNNSIMAPKKSHPSGVEQRKKKKSAKEKRSKCLVNAFVRHGWMGRCNAEFLANLLFSPAS